MTFKKKVFLLYAVALLVAAAVFFLLDGKADLVGSDRVKLYAIELLVVVVPAVSLFFAYSWDNMPFNRKRLVKVRGEERVRMLQRFAYIKIGFFVFSLWACTLCYVMASYSHNRKYGIIVALLHGLLVIPKFSSIED